MLFALCCAIAVDLASQLTAEPPGPTPAEPHAVLAELSTPGWEERAPILERNLFGTQLTQALPPEPIAEEEIEKTDLPVELVGTIASPDLEARMASVWNQDEREYQVLRPGELLDDLPEVRLARVERGRVLLRNGGEVEELLLEDRKARRESPAVRAARARAARKEELRRRRRSLRNR